MRESTGVIAIGRKSEGEAGGLTFGTGEITTSFQAQGSMPLFIVKLTNLAKMLLSLKAQSFSLEH